MRVLVRGRREAPAGHSPIAVGRSLAAAHYWRLVPLNGLRGNWDAVPAIAAEVLAQPELPSMAEIFANSSLGLVRCRRGEPDGIALLER